MVRRTKEEALGTRERLLDAAEVLFQAQGVSQTSLQQIAQQAGTTRGAIYWHFKDKAAIFNAMMDRVTLPLEASVQAAAKSAAGDPVVELERAILNALELMVANLQVRRVLDIATHKVEYTHDMASVQQRHLDSRDACVNDFSRALRIAARRNRKPLSVPAPIAAQGLHALISGLIQNWLLNPEAFDLVVIGRRTFRAYLDGLGVPRGPCSVHPDALAAVTA